MKVIYTPSGKALEYCERAANLYRGCSHGCAYCYAPAVLRMKREAFADAKARPGVLEALVREAPQHAGREVLLCFTTDPYHPGSDMTTRLAIEALQSAGCRVTTLTKGGARSERDFDLLRPGLDRYGSTLTFTSVVDSAEWEPSAALPGERIRALKRAHDLGIETWASFEPVIDPEQTLALIRSTKGTVDLCKIGKWNHDPRAKAIDWADFARRAVDLCESTGRRYMLKADLAAELESGRPAAGSSLG